MAALAAFVLLQVYLIGIARHETLFLDVSPHDTPSPRIFGPRKVGQTFSVRKNGLSRLDVLVGTYGRAVGADLRFELWEVKPAEILAAETTIPASALKDNLFASAVFKPVRRSEGKTYKFAVSAPGAAGDDSVSLWMSSRDIYRGGETLFNDSPAGGDIVFRAYAKRPVIAELGRVTSKYPGILGSPLVFVLAAVLSEGILIYFFWRLLGGLFGGKGPHV